MIDSFYLNDKEAHDMENMNVAEVRIVLRAPGAC